VYSVQGTAKNIAWYCVLVQCDIHQKQLLFYESATTLLKATIHAKKCLLKVNWCQQTGNIEACPTDEIC